MAEYRALDLAGINPTETIGHADDFNFANEFYVTSQCWVTRVHYYRTRTDIGAAAACLFEVIDSATGTYIDSGPGSYSGPSIGWRTYTLDVPIELVPNQRYKVAFLFTNGNYNATPDYWSTGSGSSGHTNGPLVMVGSSTSTGGQGTFHRNGGTSDYPNTNWTGDNAWLDVTVTDIDPNNTAPTADAGPDQTVIEGDLVQLDGTGSSDAEDGSAGLSYEWTVQVAGGTGLVDGDITNRLTSTPSFTAPDVASTANIVIQLEVTDSGGLTDTDTVTITVNPEPVSLAVDFVVQSDLTIDTPAVVARPEVTFTAATSLDVALGRVARPSVAFEVASSLAVALGRVWHTAAVEPFVVESALVVDVAVGVTFAAPSGSLRVVSRRQLYVPAQRRGLRFIAQDILTGEFLDWDLPIRGVEIAYVLSGSKSITGKIEPEITDIGELGLKSRGTWIHAEQDGQIRASGILQPGSLAGASLSIDAAGFTSYLHTVPYRGLFEGIQVDPLDVVRHIFGHVQSYATGNMNITIDTTTSPVRIGTEPRDVEFETGEGEQISFEAGPYKLNWWTSTICGQELDQLAKETPFDYIEQDFWNADKTDVLHNLKLGYPRVGGKRPNLTFTEDENITEVVPIGEDPELYASEVIMMGAGEGRDMIQGSYVGVPDGRLRTPLVIEDTEITRTERARAFAEDEWLRRQATVGIEQIVINARHDNAKLGAFAEGDDILVQADVPYMGRIGLWHRITGYKVTEDGNSATLTLRRSDTFRYNRGGGGV